jgi:hypothetical protein
MATPYQVSGPAGIAAYNSQNPQAAPSDPIRDTAILQALGFDPQSAPAGPEMGGSSPAAMAQLLPQAGAIADQFVPDPVIAAGRSLIRGTPYQDERNSLQNYRQETALQNTPSEVKDPKYQGLYDNKEQQDKAMQDAMQTVMATAGGPPGKGGWKVPGKSKVTDIGPGFLNQVTGELHGPLPFHDLNAVPEGQIPNLEGDGGWVMKGTGPGLPRYFTRAEAAASDFNGGVHAPDPQAMNGLQAHNEAMDPGRVIGSVDQNFAKHLPEDASKQPKYFSRSPEPEMPTSGLPDYKADPNSFYNRGSETAHPSMPDQTFAQSDLWKEIEKNLSDKKAWEDPNAWFNRPIGTKNPEHLKQAVPGPSNSPMSPRTGEPPLPEQNREFQEWLLNFLKDAGPAGASNWPPPIPGGNR